MDITPTPEFCAACRIVLGGDTPDIVIHAMRTELATEIQRAHADILAGRRVITMPLDPPAGTKRPDPNMLNAVQQIAERDEA